MFVVAAPMNCSLIASLCLFFFAFGPALHLHAKDDAEDGAAGPVRVLFLGHEGEQHNSNKFFPMVAKALGTDAIYFDYVTTVGAALDDAAHLATFDALLLYANHGTIEPKQWANLKAFINNGGGFIPVHCASWCFGNEAEFDQLVGARFDSHKTGVFTPRTVLPDHEAIAGVPPMTAWDETYCHKNHNADKRTVLQVRDVMEDDPITEPEPWTWVRTHGEGRIFYTASGHDERVWGHPSFHALLKQGILWSIGPERRASYTHFITHRAPLMYEEGRGNIPNYEKRPQPLNYQLPLAPADSLAYTRAPAGFRLELFASEPDIINPIAIAWDERGRLWALETTDYPNEIKEGRTGADKVKILEDTDGDGRCDKVTVFAEGFNIPTSLVFANGGVIVAHAPDFFFLKDTDGDDKADVRKVINTGWGAGDTHAGPSNLRYGFDNRIWGAVGYSGYNNDGKRFGSGLFKMERGGDGITFLHQFNNNTWGLGFNAQGDVFGSTANNNPSFFCGLPRPVYGASNGRSARMIADSPTFHPITPNIRQVDALGSYTAAAGHAIATSPNFPKAWQNQMAFVCGPTGNLLGGYRLIPEGSGYQAKNAFALVASADEWFSPVMAEVGPDGNLWIADWYNFIIQHNPTPSADRGGYDAKRGQGNAHINPNRDRQHGRIYRMVRDGKDARNAPKPISLADAKPGKLLATLDHPNMFWRMTAQRLLVENSPKGKGLLRRLRERASAPGESGPLGAIHALWTLHGIGELDRATQQAALLQADPDLKRNAVETLGIGAEDMQLFFDTALIADKDPRVRRAAFTKMATFPASDLVNAVLPRLYADAANRDDEWLAAALKAAAGNQGTDLSAGKRVLGENLLKNPGFEEVAEGKPTHWVERTYSGTGVWNHETRKDFVRSGKGSVRIQSGTGGDISWSTFVEVEPNTEYLLSGWVRTRGLAGAMGALLNIHSHEEATTPAHRKTTDWIKVEKRVNSEGKNQFQVNALFGGWGQSRGQAWYDDLSLQKVTVVADEDATSGKLVGDAERGKTIFTTHPVASCTRCHKVGELGEGVVGPNLATIATRKGSDYIRKSLVDPQADIAEGYPVAVSPMPPYGLLLKPQELEDVLAYLGTLK